MPQTKKQIEALLDGAGARPNRRLGQNFLIDGNLMRKLVDTAEIAPDDIVLEVGAGTGSLTEMLIERAGRVVAIEYDRALYELVNSRIGSSGNLTLLNVDALANKNRLATELVAAVQDAYKHTSGRFLLVANLPYHIAAPLIIDLLLSGLGIHHLCFTVQTEMAERITSPPGHKSYGPLSIVTQALCDAKHITELPPSVFWPPPQITSSMLRLDWNAGKASRLADPMHFVNVVRTCFLHRRKRLNHALAYLYGGKKSTLPDSLKSADLNRRPEELSIDQWIDLADRILACE